ncbi:MAG: glycosyltransferase family 2 protein [Meiothermus sp.]|nr:glycosyltransferase family 2 protein [Meiothermus sp.]
MNPLQTHVEILLATYNGAKYLEAQLESLFSQTFQHWRILARDDGSSDGTVEILRDFVERYPQRLEIIKDGQLGLGAKGNFARLMQHSRAPYVMFCDQDDIWLPNKIEQTLGAMLTLEATIGRQTPILVCTDLAVVDGNLQAIAPSLAAYQHLEPASGQPWKKLLVQNFVTGCTVMINQALCERAMPIPPEAKMHDWWLGLVAGVFGHLEYIPTATLLYRQHGSNDTGAAAWNLATIRRKATTIQQSIRSSQQQARAFQLRFGGQIPRVIQEFADLSAHGFLSRRLWLWRNRVTYTGLARNLGFWLFV